MEQVIPKAGSWHATRRLGSRVDTTTGRPAPFEQPSLTAGGFVGRSVEGGFAPAMQSVRGAIMDRSGRPSISSTGALTAAPGSRFFWHLQQRNAGPWPVAVDVRSRMRYLFEETQGRSALFRMTLTVGPPRARHRLRSGRRRRAVWSVVADRGSFATDRRQWVFFDPQFRQLDRAIGADPAATPLISFVKCRTSDIAGLGRQRDTIRSSYYVFNRDTRQLNQVLQSRLELAGVTPALSAITYRAADGTRFRSLIAAAGGTGAACRRS
jgi:hypothetical protein